MHNFNTACPLFFIQDVSISSQEVSGAVITQEDISLVDTEKTAVDSVSEDLPKPPDLEEFPPLPENLDQYDITEDELKAVQLPITTDSKNVNDRIVDDATVDIAASKIQAGVRGYLTRKQIKGEKQNIEVCCNYVTFRL